MFSTPSSTTSQAASQNKRSTPTLISADVVILGVLQSLGDMQVDGRVEGNLRGQNLVIGEDAEIHGEIEAEFVTVRGKVEGSIRARKITLAAGSHVQGDIVHETLEVEFGAFLQGQVRHCANPLTDLLPQPAESDDAETAERRRPGSPMRDASGQENDASPPAKIAVNG